MDAACGASACVWVCVYVAGLAARARIQVYTTVDAVFVLSTPVTAERRRGGVRSRRCRSQTQRQSPGHVLALTSDQLLMSPAVDSPLASPTRDCRRSIPLSSISFRSASCIAPRKSRSHDSVSVSTNNRFLPRVGAGCRVDASLPRLSLGRAAAIKQVHKGGLRASPS